MLRHGFQDLLRRGSEEDSSPATGTPASSQHLPSSARLPSPRRQRSLDFVAPPGAPKPLRSSAGLPMPPGRRWKSIEHVLEVMRRWAPDGEAAAQLADRADERETRAKGRESDCRVTGKPDDYRDDDEFSSQASTHASRDPFLNDESSIPMSSTGDLNFRAKCGDVGVGDDVEDVERPDFFSDMPSEQVPLTRQKSRYRERERIKERERCRSSSALSVRKRSWAPVLGFGRSSTEVVGLIGSSDVDFFGEETGGMDFVDDISVLPSASTGEGDGIDLGTAAGKNEMSLETEDDSSTFQPMSTFGGEAMRSSNSHSLRSSASSMQRRSALWRASRATDTNLVGLQSPHEAATLGIVTHCETAVREGSPAAAVRLIDAVDEQILAVEGEMKIARDVLLQTREKAHALETARLPEYEQLLYGGDVQARFECGETAATRAEDQAAFEEFRLSRAVWDIEEAVYGRQWHDAVKMVKSVRHEHHYRLDGDRCVAKSLSSSVRDYEQKDRFAEPRAGFYAALSLLSSEIVAFSLDPMNVLDVPDYVPLLIRLELEDEARQALLLSGSATLTLRLDEIRAEATGCALTDRTKFVTSVTVHLFSQLCESCAELGEVPGLDGPADEASFVKWAVTLIDATYVCYLQPVLESKDVDIFEMAQLVSGIRNATLHVVACGMIEEVGLIFDSRLYRLIRDGIFTKLSRYQSVFASRASALGSLPVAKWSGSPLRSSQAICDELETFTQQVALEILGIDRGIDHLLASVLTVTCSVYASNLLHVKNVAQARSIGKKMEHRLSRALSDTASKTLKAVSDALASAASADHVLGSNGAILWIVSHLKDGAHCDEERLRQVGLASVPKRLRPSPAFRSQKLSLIDAQLAPLPTAVNATFGLYNSSSERLDSLAAREIVRTILDKERRHSAH